MLVAVAPARCTTATSTSGARGHDGGAEDRVQALRTHASVTGVAAILRWAAVAACATPTVAVAGAARPPPRSTHGATTRHSGSGLAGRAAHADKNEPGRASVIAPTQLSAEHPLQQTAPGRQT